MLVANHVTQDTIIITFLFTMLEMTIHKGKKKTVKKKKNSELWIFYTDVTVCQDQNKSG